MPPPIRTAVLGLGFMGSKHVDAFLTAPNSELVAVYTRDQRKLSGDLSSIQGNLGGPGKVYDFTAVKQYTNLDAVLEDPDIDAVDICLPTDLHASTVIAALRAGKDVLVEKPMALDLASSQSMLQAAETSSRVLMVAHVLRFFPEYQALIKALGSGQYGRVRSASFRRRCAAPAWSGWLADAKQSGGGAFDLLIHDVDICLSLFGSPKSVTAIGYEALASGIDVIHARLYYSNSLTVEVSGGWHHPEAFPFSMEYTAVLDDATINYRFETNPPTLYSKEGEQTVLPLASHDGYLAEVEYFLQCVQDKQFPALCPPRESARAVGLMNLLLQSRASNGTTIKCHL